MIIENVIIVKIAKKIDIKESKKILFESPICIAVKIAEDKVCVSPEMFPAITILAPNSEIDLINPKNIAEKIPFLILGNIT